jgi:hypothetical protein
MFSAVLMRAGGRRRTKLTKLPSGSEHEGMEDAREGVVSEVVSRSEPSS